MSTEKKTKRAFRLDEHLKELEGYWEDDSRWPFHPAVSGFGVLDEFMGGFRDGTYLVAGGPGTGKTSFVTQLLFLLMHKNPTMQGVFLSLDQPYLDIVTRMFALCSELPVEMIRNPRKIQDREDMEKRLRGFEILEGIRERLQILDQSHDTFRLEDVEELLASAREEADDAPLMLAVDPVLELAVSGLYTPEDKAGKIMEELRRMARKYRAGILLGAHLEKAQRGQRPTISDLQNLPGLVYGADFVGLLYNDSLNDFESPFLEWEWGTENLMVPLVELNVVKNKHRKELGRLFYRFYNEETRYKECTQAENDHYNEMLNNLDHFDKSPGKRKKSGEKKVYVAPKRKEYEGIF